METYNLWKQFLVLRKAHKTSMFKSQSSTSGEWTTSVQRRPVQQAMPGFDRHLGAALKCVPT